ncbi:MAG TPA: hypothetical protein VGJ44_07630 [Kribbellaceae bacterium]|jgi:hypothetical protein
MNPTHQQNNHAPEPVSRRFDGLPETEADRRFFDLRESGYTGWIDQDGYPVFDLDAWYAQVAATRDAASGADATDGYVVTEAGRQVLTETRPTHDLELAAADEAPGTVPQTLRNAALYLERHGWIQGSYYDATSGVFTPPACLVVAIGMVCYGGPVEAPAQHFDDPGFADFEEAVLHLDRYLLVEDGSESYEFNDARGRTVHDVTYVLRRAAAVPAEELDDALRAINEQNARMADLVGGDAE